MRLPTFKYGYFLCPITILREIGMLKEQLDQALKTLTAEPNMKFHGKNHLIQLVMFRSGLFMCEESFKDVETYLGENLGVLLRDYGERS